MSKPLRFAGDVEIIEVSLTSLNGQTANITNQVEMIEVYEDLFSSFTTMAITIVESVDYLNLFPFCGEEYVDINIDTPTLNKPINGRYYVTKIDSYAKIKERQAAYVLRCASEEFVVDANKKLSQSFSGNAAEIALKILGRAGLNTKKKINVEQSTSKTKFIALNWAPSKCLNYLAEGVTNVNNSPSFLFFENRDGLNFVSMNKLILDNTKFSFVKDNYSRDLTQTGSSIANFNEDYKRIISYELPVLTDYISDVATGRIKSRVITHDLTTKTLTVADYSAKTDNSNALLNKYNSYSKRALGAATGTIYLVPRYISAFDGFADVSMAKTVQKRSAVVEGLKRYTMQMEVIGRTDYTVGITVDVNIPKSTQITKEDSDPRDGILSGKYIVTAINHTITRDGHKCTMELMKNSLIIDLDKQ